MKKLLFLSFALTIISLGALAQIVNFPSVNTADSHVTVIKKVETGKQYTVVTFDHYATHDSSWVVLNKEIYLQTDAGNKHYNFIKAEGVAVAPETRHTLTKAGDKVSFKVYFEKIPAGTKSIDIIEHAGKRDDGISFFNFYGVDLTHSNASAQEVKITEVVLAPPPATIQIDGDSVPVDTSGLSGLMSSFGPMYASMVKSMMDAQLSFYKQPGKITELAKLNKQYYDALVKEGFTKEEALKIITTESLLPKAAATSGK
ncbi:hypothetical protein [Mucilaginibacter pedocola]|uniref:Uncharacterized protein n=1 Tax=Mucilaginibacter pedocola TaxID=1792845 RepID=A0A1S9PET9_9SPHI|nr:hypothetical protein [Mucilaginibacter pedocola]OOQ59444.1 hypothetical protein BC343_04480 [Mucilaginibacter pedocola]